MADGYEWYFATSHREAFLNDSGVERQGFEN
jgi:hypothetical protein